MTEKVIVAIIIFVAVALETHKLIKSLSGNGRSCDACKSCGCGCRCCDNLTGETNHADVVEEHSTE